MWEINEIEIEDLKNKIKNLEETIEEKNNIMWKLCEENLRIIQREKLSNEINRLEKRKIVLKNTKEKEENAETWHNEEKTKKIREKLEEIEKQIENNRKKYDENAKEIMKDWLL